MVGPGFVQRSSMIAPLRIVAPTTQDIAIVVCGGGDPFAEWEIAREMCERAGKTYSIFAGNDMIERFPHDIDHAITLHPEKLSIWLPRRLANGFNAAPKVWAHRNYESAVTHWTRDWSGSTGLMCVKVARENGFTHIVTCGVHMLSESGHFVRKQEWTAANGFRRGWLAHTSQLRPYLRSMGGWTQEIFGAPTEQWITEDIRDEHSRAPDPEDLKA